MFMIIEIVGGIKSDSLAILCDAAHMMSDVSGFFIQIVAIYISKKKPTLNASWGYYRAEVLGALASILFIWILVAWLLVEAYKRLMNESKYEINSEIMIGISFISLACNIFNFMALSDISCCSSKTNAESLLEGGNSNSVSPVKSDENDDDFENAKT